jgi:hypothetical protein
MSNSTKLAYLVLVTLAVIIWAKILVPPRPAPLPPSPVTCDDLFKVMRRNYDTEAYDFRCVEGRAGYVKLEIHP